MALAALRQCLQVTLWLVVDGSSDGAAIVNLEEATATLPSTPIADESLGTPMLYSSGTAGRPKGILRPLPEQPPGQALQVFDTLIKLWRFNEGLVYLSPAPLNHAAPNAGVNFTIRMGGTAVIMERFDPEHLLRLVETNRVTHSQLVPTMFSRMLKLPGEAPARHDCSALQLAIHAAAPCPVQLKQQMIDWWGPIILEYYGSTGANGIHRLRHRRVVGAQGHGGTAPIR